MVEVGGFTIKAVFFFFSEYISDEPKLKQVLLGKDGKIKRKRGSSCFIPSNMLTQQLGAGGDPEILWSDERAPKCDISRALSEMLLPSRTTDQKFNFANRGPCCTLRRTFMCGFRLRWSDVGGREGMLELCGRSQESVSSVRVLLFQIYQSYLNITLGWNHFRNGTWHVNKPGFSWTDSSNDPLVLRKRPPSD